MTRAEELRALAERVEREGASEMLSVQIAAALVGAHAMHSPFKDRWGLYVEDRDGALPWSPAASNAFEAAIYGCSRILLTSVDAAKTLEREGWMIEIKLNYDGVVRGGIIVIGVDFVSSRVTGPHAEPRARVSASLRALAAEAEREKA